MVLCRLRVPAYAAVEQAQANTQYDTNDICDPVVYVRAAVEAGLDEFNGAAKGARADEDRQKPKTPRAGQGEGECGEGDQVHELVAALRCRGRRLQGPEHRNGQGERHDDCKRYVEVLAHAPRFIDPQSQRQVWAYDRFIHDQVESVL